MRGGRRGSFVGAVVMMTAGGLSCQGEAGPVTPLPAGPPVVEVSLMEYRFGFTPPKTSGRVEFRFANVGKREHRPSLIPLPEDFPPIDAQVRGAERRTITPFAGILTRPPGTQGGFAVDLAPASRYTLICFVRDPDGRSHAVEGMTAEFRSPAAAGDQPVDAPRKRP